MTVTSNTIVQALGLSSMIIDDNLPVVVEENGQANMAQDFDKSRSNLRTLIDKSMTAIQKLEGLADASQSEKYYRVLNETLKTAVDANKALLEIHRNLRETNVIKQPVEQNVTNNNLFVGSTAEFQRMIEKVRNDGQSDDGRIT